MTEEDFAARFAEAVVTEIKAEMGRQDLSSRALGRLIGRSSQYMSDRLDGGNSKTGKRVTLTVTDLASIARALGLTEIELIERAQKVAHNNVVEVDFGVRGSVEDDRAVAKKKGRDRGGDDGEG